MDHKRYHELKKRDMNNDLSEKEKTDKKKTDRKLWKDRIKRWGYWKVALLGAGIIILLVIVGSIITSLFLGLTGGSDSLATNNEAVSKNDQGVPSESSSTSGVADSGFQLDVTKIIYSGNISLYTDDYQSTFEKIGEYAVALGGFVQDSSSSYVDNALNIVANSGYMTIRVPSAKFGDAMKEIQTYGTLVSSSINSTNISQEYQDIKGQLDNLKIEEARLLEYLNKAENMSDLLLIESELNRVRTEIDDRTTTIKNWDNEIAYSTIYVSVYEKEIGTSTVESPFSGLFQKITEGFIASINLILNIFAVLIVLIVRLIPFAAVLGAAYFICIKVRKKKL